MGAWGGLRSGGGRGLKVEMGKGGPAEDAPKNLLQHWWYLRWLHRLQGSGVKRGRVSKHILISLTIMPTLRTDA